MEAWQKREMEQGQFLEKLHRELTHDNEGDPLDDDNVLEVARELLIATIYELGHENLPRDETWQQISRFARTQAEGMILKRKLLVMLIKSGFHDAESAHLHERVHEQEKLYDGHRAMDEVS
jgi:hypothetical protein